jgi:hypothetical protein
VREGLLCQSVPSPPNDVVVTPPAPDPRRTVREQFEQHASDPACKGCHELFDPLGFAFENYDGIGAWRATSGGKPVDASGILTGLAEEARPFRDLRDLMGAVRASRELRDCAAGTFLRYALGRRETDGDAATVDELRRAFAASGGEVRELLIAIVQSRSFRFRTLAAGEALP